MRDLKFDTFYKYDEMTAFLMEAKKSNGDFVKVNILTKTPEERNVFLAAITDFTVGSADEKPAYYVQAGVHAEEGAGTTAALHVIYSLLTKRRFKELLKKVSFYVIPRVNPDGTEYALNTRGSIRSRFEKTSKRNGLIPKDLNGDGHILYMRWQDSSGQFKEDEIDSRIMVRREPGNNKGPFYNMVTEGLIHDYDGTKIVSGIRNIDFNRNWPINWQSTDVSSSYPFSEPETRAIGDFMINHPNIFAGVDFHCGTNAILRPTSKPDSEINQNDLELILSIGHLAEKITGFPLMNIRDEYKNSKSHVPTVINGWFNDWAHFWLGISNYCIELGNGYNCAGISAREFLDADQKTKETIFMRRVFKFHDKHNSQIFVPWKEFNHPQLGKVEIGGLMHGSAYFMYPPIMEKVVPKTTKFILSHAQKHPELIITNIETLALADDVYRIRATVTNIGEFSTNVMKGGGAPDMQYPVSVKLFIHKGIKLLSRTDLFEFNRLEGRGGTGYMEWFIKTRKEKITLEASHPKAGLVKKEILL